MILKPHSTDPIPSDPRLRAGLQAERQMAHYLHRAFATSSNLYVINDLRLVDPEQPEHDGSPGVAQIDHLVLHRYGAFIVESKSVTGTVTVRDDGGGDEWTRGGTGMPSPLRQAERQGEFLRAFLNRHSEQLLGKIGTGLRTLSRLVHGTDQRGFGYFPVQSIVAIADQGQIKRLKGWKPRGEDFATFVLKADNVPGVIRAEVKKHVQGAKVVVTTSHGLMDNYGTWRMSDHELAAVADFLVASHTPRLAKRATASAPKAPRASEAPKPSEPVRTSPGSVEPAAAEPAPGAPTPACPRCGTPTVLRYAKKGANAGQPFFGCPKFPKCRGVVPIAGASGEP
ncbi:MAG: NERD domain-containing protein [Phycisphaerales bacterium]